jgi:predicted transcriptional regulator
MQQARQFTRVVTAYNPHMYQHQQMQAQAHAHAQQQYQQQQYQQQVQAQQQAHAHLQAQQQQQMQQQQQPQQMMAMMQQLMMQLQGNTQAGPNTAVPAEMTELWFKIGSSLGAMMQEKGGPAVLTNPQAMCSIVEAVLKQTTGDPDAAMQQLAATMAAAGTAM